MTITQTIRLASLTFAVALAAASLEACTPKDQADLKNVGANTAAIAQQNAQKLESRIDQGVDKALVAGAAAARAAGSALDDTAITAEITASLAKDSELRAFGIDVHTTNGRVALRGAVPNIVARQRASDIARGAKGAKDVENQLTIGAASDYN